MQASMLCLMQRSMQVSMQGALQVSMQGLIQRCMQREAVLHTGQGLMSGLMFLGVAV